MAKKRTIEEIEQLVDNLDKRVSNIETKVNFSNTNVTSRESEIISYFHTDSAMTIYDISKKRDISYPAARRIVLNLEKKGLIKGVLEPKGMKKLYSISGDDDEKHIQ